MESAETLRSGGGRALDEPLLEILRLAGVGNQIAVTRVLLADHGKHGPASGQQLRALFADPRARFGAPLRLGSGVLAAREGLDLLGDPHAAPIVAAHRAEVGVDLEILVVQSA